MAGDLTTVQLRVLLARIAICRSPSSSIFEAARRMNVRFSLSTTEGLSFGAIAPEPVREIIRCTLAFFIAGTIFSIAALKISLLCVPQLPRALITISWPSRASETCLVLCTSPSTISRSLCSVRLELECTKARIWWPSRKSF